MKKKVSRELEALETRIRKLKETVNSRKGHLDDQWEKIMNSAKVSKGIRLGDRGRFPKDLF